MAGTAKRDHDDPKAANGLSRSHQAAPTLDRVAQAHIGNKLRAMYGELADQPVPDRLTAILERLSSTRESGS